LKKDRKEKPKTLFKTQITDSIETSLTNMRRYNNFGGYLLTATDKFIVFTPERSLQYAKN